MFYFFIALAFNENVADMSHSRAQMISMMEMPKKIPMVPPNWETRQSSWQTKYSSLAGQVLSFHNLVCLIVYLIVIVIFVPGLLNHVPVDQLDSHSPIRISVLKRKNAGKANQY